MEFLTFALGEVPLLRFRHCNYLRYVGNEGSEISFFTFNVTKPTKLIAKRSIVNHTNSIRGLKRLSDVTELLSRNLIDFSTELPKRPNEHMGHANGNVQVRKATGGTTDPFDMSKYSSFANNVLIQPKLVVSKVGLSPMIHRQFIPSFDAILIAIPQHFHKMNTA